MTRAVAVGVVAPGLGGAGGAPGMVAGGVVVAVVGGTGVLGAGAGAIGAGESAVSPLTGTSRPCSIHHRPPPASASTAAVAPASRSPRELRPGRGALAGELVHEAGTDGASSDAAAAMPARSAEARRSVASTVSASGACGT